MTSNVMCAYNRMYGAVLFLKSTRGQMFHKPVKEHIMRLAPP